jgi:hypothetical protein
MRMIGKSLAFLCAVGFVLAAATTSLLLGARATFFSPETYKDALSENQIYERLAGVIARELVHSAQYNPCEQNPDLCEGEDTAEGEEDGPPAYIENLDAETWETIITTLAPPGWLKTQVDSFIDQAFNLKHVDKPIEISLVELKERIAGPEGRQVIEQVIAVQPPCTAAQMESMVVDGSQGEPVDAMLTCRPPDELMDEMMPSVRAELQQAAAEIPDVARIPHPLQGVKAQNAPMNGFMSPARAVDVFRWSPLLAMCPALLLLFAAVFGARSLPSLLKWWGWPLLLTGIIGLGLALGYYPLRRMTANLVVGNASAAFTQESMQLILDVFHSVTERFTAYSLITSGALVVTGAGLLITTLVQGRLPSSDTR